MEDSSRNQVKNNQKRQLSKQEKTDWVHVYMCEALFLLS